MSIATGTLRYSSQATAVGTHRFITKLRPRNRSGRRIGTGARGDKRTCAGPLSCPSPRARVTGRNRSASCRGKWTSAAACVRRSCRISRWVLHRNLCIQAQSEGRTHQQQSKVCTFYYALFPKTSIFYCSHGDYEIVLVNCSEIYYLLSQTLSYMLQTLLTGQYSILPNNLSSPQVHLVMHQLNQCYTQLAWQQNNIQR